MLGGLLVPGVVSNLGSSKGAHFCPTNMITFAGQHYLQNHLCVNVTTGVTYHINCNCTLKGQQLHTHSGAPTASYLSSCNKETLMADATCTHWSLSQATVHAHSV